MESKLHQKALLLSYFTVGYNILEGIVSIAAGVMAGSIALVGFGLDSFIESISGSVMIWRFRGREKMTEEEEMRIEKKAIRFVACTFFILGAYVLYESFNKLYFQEVADPSLPGIIIAIASLIIMPLLFQMKLKTGKALKSRSLVADSKQTLACMFLSFTLLIGLGLNYLFGLWQADPIIGFIIVVYLFKEGYMALKEEKLCSC